MSIKTQHIKSVLRKDGIIPQEIDVWLRAGEIARAFHCPNCGRFQFSMKHRIISIMDENMTSILKIPPISLQCQRCGNIFNIHIF